MTKILLDEKGNIDIRGACGSIWKGGCKIMKGSNGSMELNLDCELDKVYDCNEGDGMKGNPKEKKFYKMVTFLEYRKIGDELHKQFLKKFKVAKTRAEKQKAVDWFNREIFKYDIIEENPRPNPSLAPLLNPFLTTIGIMENPKRTKAQIAKEWKKLTFTPMKGVKERSIEELERVLKYEKSIRGGNPKTKLSKEAGIEVMSVERHIKGWLRAMGRKDYKEAERINKGKIRPVLGKGILPYAPSKEEIRSPEKFINFVKCSYQVKKKGGVKSPVGVCRASVFSNPKLSSILKVGTIRLSKGTKIYYHGDMVNDPGHGTITETYQNKWGEFVDIKMDDGRDIKKLPKVMFSEKYLGHGGTRFVTEKAYKEWKRAQMEKYKSKKNIRSNPSLAPPHVPLPLITLIRVPEKIIIRSDQELVDVLLKT